MPKLTVEFLSNHRENCEGHKDALVLCIDGEMVPGQVRSELKCGVDQIPEFTVTLSLFSGDGYCALKVN